MPTRRLSKRYIGRSRSARGRACRGGPMKSKWITHKGQQIWFHDQSHFGRDVAGFKAELEANNAYVCQQALQSMVVVLDLRESLPGKETIEALRQSALRVMPHLRKLAVVLSIHLAPSIQQVLFDNIMQMAG